MRPTPAEVLDLRQRVQLAASRGTPYVGIRPHHLLRLLAFYEAGNAVAETFDLEPEDIDANRIEQEISDAIEDGAE